MEMDDGSFARISFNSMTYFALKECWDYRTIAIPEINMIIDHDTRSLQRPTIRVEHLECTASEMQINGETLLVSAGTNNQP